MPNDLNIAWFVLGAVLLLCSIIGGEFKIFGAEFSSKISNIWIRILCLLLSIVCFSIIYNPFKIWRESFKDASSNSVHYKVHLTQYNTSNYSPYIMKYLIGEINKSSKYLSFIYHDNRKELSDTNSSVQVFKQLKIDYPKVESNNILVGLVPFRLENNYFSIKRSNYSVISTVDFDIKVFNPAKDTLLIYKYILHQSISHFFITLGNINFHKANETQGCILDYRFHKKEIINTINNPAICAEHRNVLRKTFTESRLNEFEQIIKFAWLENPIVKNKLAQLYNLKL